VALAQRSWQTSPLIWWASAASTPEHLATVGLPPALQVSVLACLPAWERGRQLREALCMHA
jgi:hypothetical protein